MFLGRPAGLKKGVRGPHSQIHNRNWILQFSNCGPSSLVLAAMAPRLRRKGPPPPAVRRGLSGSIVKLPAKSRWLESICDLQDILSKQHSCVKARVQLSFEGSEIHPCEKLKYYAGKELELYVSTDATLLPDDVELAVLVYNLVSDNAAKFESGARFLCRMEHHWQMPPGALGPVAPVVSFMRKCCEHLNLNEAFSEFAIHTEDAYGLAPGHLLNMQEMMLGLCECAHISGGRVCKHYFSP